MLSSLLTIMSLGINKRLDRQRLCTYTIQVMKKKTAIELFGSASKLSRAVQYTRGAIHNWPDELDRRRSDQVIGAAVGKLSPAQAKELIEHERQRHERSQSSAN